MALFSKNGFREATQKNVTLEILAEGMPSVFCLVFSDSVACFYVCKSLLTPDVVIKVTIIP
jgi:hypothetical protein